MKKRIISFLLALCIASLLTVGVYAASSEPQLPCITDVAELLDDTESLRLEQMAQSIGQQYGVGVYVVTVDDYREIDTAGVYEATYGIYHEYTMGIGDNRNGIMLLLSMRERDYALFCYGDKAEYAFNDYGLKKLEENFLDNFRENDWNGGFEDYIRSCASYLSQAAEGNPVSRSPVKYILISVAVSLVIAAIVCAVLVSGMKTVRKKKSAEAYAADGLDLTEQYDRFTHHTETRRKIERSSSSSGSHSGGGGSGRSGKF